MTVKPPQCPCGLTPGYAAPEAHDNPACPHNPRGAAQEIRQHDCDQCGGAGWVPIAGHVTGAPYGYVTVTECMACNPDGAIPWRDQFDLGAQ